MTDTYLLNDAGDIWAKVGADGKPVEVDPSEWGWHGAKTVDPPEWRRTLDELIAMPEFTVTVTEGPRFEPGPRRPTARWMAWADGAAPPTAAESRGGIKGTVAYVDRLSDALGRSSRRLAERLERAPFLVHDFVGGRLIRMD